MERECCDRPNALSPLVSPHVCRPALPLYPRCRRKPPVASSRQARLPCTCAGPVLHVCQGCGRPAHAAQGRCTRLHRWHPFLSVRQGGGAAEQRGATVGRCRADGRRRPICPACCPATAAPLPRPLPLPPQRGQGGGGGPPEAAPAARRHGQGTRRGARACRGLAQAGLKGPAAAAWTRPACRRAAAPRCRPRLEPLICNCSVARLAHFRSTHTHALGSASHRPCSTHSQ